MSNGGGQVLALGRQGGREGASEAISQTAHARGGGGGSLCFLVRQQAQ